MSMTPQMLQLLGAKLNLSAAEADALQSGNYAQFFSERLGSDPSLASDPMMLMLMNGLAGSAPSDAAGDDADEADDADAAHAGQNATGDVIDIDPAAAADRADVAARALSALREVAAILGACHCWGQDRDCVDCAGHGRPGHRRPSDPATFLTWVQPALHTLGFCLARWEAGSGDHTNRRKDDARRTARPRG